MKISENFIMLLVILTIFSVAIFISFSYSEELIKSKEKMKSLCESFNGTEVIGGCVIQNENGIYEKHSYEFKDGEPYLLKECTTPKDEFWHFEKGGN